MTYSKGQSLFQRLSSSFKKASLERRESALRDAEVTGAIKKLQGILGRKLDSDSEKALLFWFAVNSYALCEELDFIPEGFIRASALLIEEHLSEKEVHH